MISIENRTPNTYDVFLDIEGAVTFAGSFHRIGFHRWAADGDAYTSRKAAAIALARRTVATRFADADISFAFRGVAVAA